MSEVGGLQKHQNNPACTKHVKSLQNVEAGHCTEEDGRRFCHLLRSCQSCLVFRFASGQSFHTTVLTINRYLSSFIIRDIYDNRICAPSCSPWTLEVTSNMANTETEAGLIDVTIMANTETGGADWCNRDGKYWNRDFTDWCSHEWQLLFTLFLKEEEEEDSSYFVMMA